MVAVEMHFFLLVEVNEVLHESDERHFQVLVMQRMIFFASNIQYIIWINVRNSFTAS